MNATRANTIELPRKPAGAFFRWEEQGEPIAVHFHLNIMDSLESDCIRAADKDVAGVLLGRIESNRTPNLIVEDYEPTKAAKNRGSTGAEAGDGKSLQEIVERWRARPEKRISVLGVYRSVPEGRASLKTEDLKLFDADSLASERIFLLIETQKGKVSKGNLYLVREGVVVWQWHSIVLNQRHADDTRISNSAPDASSRESSSQLRKAATSESDTANIRSGKHHKMDRRKIWAAGIAGTLVIVATGIIPLRGSEMSDLVSRIFKTSKTRVPLDLKLQRIGNDWELSWDRSSAVMQKAAAGRLLITDGSARKSVDLSTDELLSGKIMYTPASDDVILRLEIVSPESVPLASGTVRSLSGVAPAPPIPAQRVSGSLDPRSQPDGSNYSPRSHDAQMDDSSREDRSRGSSKDAASNPPPSQVALTMLPPTTSIGHQIGNFEMTVAPPDLAGATRDVDTFALPPSPAKAPEPNEPQPEPEPEKSPAAKPASHPAVLQQPAELISGQKPVYPGFARTGGLTGTVELKLHVAATGKIEGITVLKGSTVLAGAAVQAAKTWRYKPARLDGTPVESDVETTIVFKLN